MNLKSVRDNVTRYGLQAGIHDVAQRAIRRVMFFKIINCLDLSLDNLSPEFLAPDPRFTCRFLTEEELVRFAGPEHELDVPFIRDALGKGDRCFGILEGEVLASYGWYSRCPTDITPELRFHFDSRDVYMYKGYTPAAFRGQRLHAFGMALALAAYVAEGARGLVSYVESTNFASLRSCERLGYRDIGRIYIARPLHRFRIHSTGRCHERGVWVEAVGQGRQAGGIAA